MCLRWKLRKFSLFLAVRNIIKETSTNFILVNISFLFSTGGCLQPGTSIFT